MTFEEWHAEQNAPYASRQCPHVEWERAAWDAALAQRDAEIARLAALLVSESELRLAAEASLHNLEAATRKVVEAADSVLANFHRQHLDVVSGSRCGTDLSDALADPVLVKLRRE